MAQIVTNQGAIAAEPITLAEAKAHLRVEWNEEDSHIQGLISQCRQTAELFTGTYFVSRTAEIYIDEWPSSNNRLELEAFPVTAISSVQYRDAAGSWQTMATPATYIYSVIGNPAVIQPVSQWPTAELWPLNPIRVNCTIGHSVIPGPVKAAILLDIGHRFANREAVNVGTSAIVQASELPNGYKHLLYNFVRHGNR